MQVWSVGIEGYRSIRRLHFPLKRLNVFIGENGVGKTNLYRGLQLVQAAAAGTLTRELAMGGGMERALWTGPRRVHKQGGETLIEGVSRLGVVDDGDD